ncbi:MOSC N-terminal beta barrel domain-containing protein [Streptomyces sp. RTGN2]|uniref:MOSC N-terminal beta barrel domain-containing protein n=1 Tax=Streptomyces sp. RTGN2 TaxID=3016525 RepID=UPI0025527AA6|nr:MOSC N-terminal beta barrel domain-containing protein [Streptomyces sp. RTGN2]
MLSAELRAVHIHPVGSPAAQAVGEAVVEPWGLDGDRRWMPAGTAGKVVTRRQQPRTALISATPSPGGGITPAAPGSAALTVEVPEPRGTVNALPHRGPGAALRPESASDPWHGGRHPGRGPGQYPRSKNLPESGNSRGGVVRWPGEVALSSSLQRADRAVSG